MKPLSIQSYHAKHDGGTKFYTVWTIFGRKRAVTVTQWGPNSAYMRGSAEGGQCKVEGFDSFHESARAGSEAMAAKRKRGYERFVKDWSTEHETEHEMGDEIRRLFGPDSTRVIVALDEKGGEATSISSKVAARPKVEPTKEPERGDVWGSW